MPEISGTYNRRKPSHTCITAGLRAYCTETPAPKEWDLSEDTDGQADERHVNIFTHRGKHKSGTIE
jgi:hypothetical protein